MKSVLQQLLPFVKVKREKFVFPFALTVHSFSSGDWKDTGSVRLTCVTRLSVSQRKRLLAKNWPPSLQRRLQSLLIWAFLLTIKARFAVYCGSSECKIVLITHSCVPGDKVHIESLYLLIWFLYGGCCYFQVFPC